MTDDNDPQSQPKPIDFGEDNTFQGPVAGGDQENYDLQGAQGPVIKPQGPVTQIWNQYQNLKVPPAVRLALVALATVIVVALVAIFFKVVEPFRQPTRMTGQFGVLVAEFREHNCRKIVADKNDKPGTDLSGWLAKTLRQELGDVDGGIDVWDNQELRNMRNARIGIVKDGDQAQKQISKFGADMLIYGTLDCSEEPAALQLNFAWKSLDILHK